MDTKAILIQAIRATDGLPAGMREHTDKVGVCESETFDGDYFSCLDSEMQKLSSKDPDKAEQLRKRRAALLPFRDTELLQGSIWTDDTAFNFWVDPKATTVIDWHEWDKERFKLGRQLIDLKNQYEAFNKKTSS
jgi:hypothetical protein